MLEDTSIKSIYFFSDYIGGIRIDKEYLIKVNAKNTFTLSGDIKTISISDKSDPTQYPQ